MKTLILYFVMAMAFSAAYAAPNNDSLAYQLQRAKINGLLAQRSQKFSQYSQSLNTKTGIFGWQTKKDIRRSGEILMDIARTDEVIFKEIKVLLDYKTFQNTQVTTAANETGDKAYNYMLTINKLRHQNEVLQEAQLAINNVHHQRQTIFIVVILVLLFLSGFLFFRKPSSNIA